MSHDQDFASSNCIRYGFHLVKQALSMTSHIHISSTNELSELAERGKWARRECGREGGSMNLIKTHYVHCEILKHQIFKKILID